MPQRFFRMLKTDNVFQGPVVRWLKTELVVLDRCPERMCEAKLPTFILCAIESVHFTQLVLTYYSLKFCQEALVHQPWKQLALPPSHIWHPRAFKQLASSVGLIIGTRRAEWGGNSLFSPSSIHLNCLSSLGRCGDQTQRRAWAGHWAQTDTVLIKGFLQNFSEDYWILTRLCRCKYRWGLVQLTGVTAQSITQHITL